MPLLLLRFTVLTELSINNLRNKLLKSRIEIICSGIVQGIGFRPFVYRIAKQFHLTGFVRNQGDAGVLIIAEGKKTDLLNFVEGLQNNKPYLAKYESFDVTWKPPTNNFDDFVIDKSSTKKVGGISYLPPDISICEDCLNDMKNPVDKRRYKYAFTSCAICGPRYTTITKLPYDRPNTTMVEFPLCPACKKEYENPLDRRYHAQTTCCNVCGPKLTLYNNKGESLPSKDLFRDIAKLIQNGSIVAIKGIGGTHLACSAVDDTPILRLRTRKGKRKTKPFALISKDLADIRLYAEVSSIEEQLLLSHRRPIVLLKKRSPFPLSKWVSPNLFNVGVMLPYSGIHSLILDEIKDPAIILTSANPSDIPMYIDNNFILSNAANLADYILLHDRTIHQRADDSVIRLANNSPVIIRRSRGWVPEPINLSFNLKENVSLGVGPLLTSTGAIALKDRCFLTQHIGDINTLETMDFLESSIEHMLSLLGVTSLTTIGSDLHPNFLSTKLAEQYSERFGASLFKIQHHFAHAVALMIDNKIPIDEEIVAIVADGVGYGDDNVIWGGEIFHTSYTHYTRIAHLEEQIMPGGDRATFYPIRMVASILSKKLDFDELHSLLSTTYLDAVPGGIEEIHVILSQLKTNLNTYRTTSTGRILAAVSALLKKCYVRTYEGEPAIVLEALAKSGTGNLEFKLSPSTNGIINTTELFYQAFLAYMRNKNPADIALAFHLALADQFADAAISYAKEHHIQKIGFTGGVAYNDIISSQIAKKVDSAGLVFIQNKSLPCGDGGISSGQAVVASLLNK